MVPESTKILLQYLELLLMVAYVLHLYSGMIMRIVKAMGGPRWSVLNLVWYWSRWPAFAWLLASPVVQFCTGDEMGVWDVAAVAICALVWWLYGNDGDDDDHKKLKKKLKEKVAAVGGKLVVEPA